MNAPDYLLAIHSSVIEGILYPVVLPSIQEDESEREGMDNFHSPPTSSVRKVDVPFATEPAISAALHFLVAQNLPTDLSDSRVMCQIYFIGKLFKINALADEVCRQGRLMINKSSSTDMPEKVCAAFDECSALERAGEEHKWWNLSFGGINELKEYALECLLDAPAKILLRGGGAKYLSADSVNEILSHPDMDTDELTMFLILNKWVKEFEGAHESKMVVAKILVKKIDFSLIPPEHLRSQVLGCDFVEKADVDAALRDIELKNSTRSPDEFEHVVVEGAGQTNVNGMYIRLEEDIGMDGSDVVFVKEATYEDGDFVDFGLYLHRNSWAIASCADYSNVLYSREIDMNTLNRKQTPEDGWVVKEGVGPAPMCHWSASKENLRGNRNRDAPNIEDFHEDVWQHKKRSTHLNNSEFSSFLLF